MPLPFSSLRANLIAAFAAVIALSLVLAVGAFAYVVSDYQAEREKDRLESVARATSGQVVRALRAGQPVAEIERLVEQVASTSGVRMLLLSERGTVVRDTQDGQLVGRPLPFPVHIGPRGVAEGAIEAPGGERVYAILPSGPPAPVRVAVLAPQQTVANTWLELLPRLAGAALGALLAAAALAWRLASSITRPVAVVTRASEEMARGHYDQQIAIPSRPDEVARLAQSFNAMAQEVARSHRAMRDLLANVSHDLRTPLTSVQGYAGALLDGTLAGPEGAREAGRVIAEEAERMRRLVEDLLYLGRIESGELALAREPLDLADLAVAAHRRFALRAEEAGVTLSLEAFAPVGALGDAHRLAQVLDNLLDNACKHTPRGGTIALAARRENSSPATALLEVRNTGSCIPADELPRLFERFYQVDKARTARSGRGLGLAIAREIVQAHGGSIEAESSPDAGTTFRVRLQVIEAPGRSALSSPPTGGIIAGSPVVA